MAVTRVSRVESKARTRDDLIVAARGVFLERGFHPATLEEISEAAGYTKGAVYSNFSGKDDLFLAVLERHYAERAAMYEAVLFGESEFEDTFRASARLMLDAFAREPAWWPLLSEFVRHAARDGALNDRLRAARDRYIDAVAGTIEQVADRHGRDLRTAGAVDRPRCRRAAPRNGRRVAHRPRFGTRRRLRRARRGLPPWARRPAARRSTR